MPVTVSIVMPVYNAASFLHQTFEGIFKQSFTDFELILINDGSTDNSEAIIQSYSDFRIRYYYQSNQGVAKTLNKGIELATGKYIWRHDADDISLPNKLEEEVKFLEQHPDIALCACQVAFMTESGKVAWKYRQPKNNYWQDGEAYKIVDRKDFNPFCPITHGTVLVRTSVMKAIGYRTEFITGEDIDAWLRLIQKYKAAVINRCLSLHRLNKGSATQKHGWKNEFFRNLSFQYYDQRRREGQDDLERGMDIILPSPPMPENFPVKKGGKNYREDLLCYLYPLHINARDIKGVWDIIKYAIKDGWKISATWKQLFYPFIGRPVRHIGAAIKRRLR